MRIGGAILVIALGAILTFAIAVDNSHGFNINTVGVILMIAGIVWLIAEVAVYGRRRRTDVVTTQAPQQVPTQTTEYRY